MAKGSLNGVRKGKKGDSVYYTITGSNNKEKQGERQYIGEVANPKTMMQAAQRMKLTPAVNFYRALGNDILNHSWQGIKYGARSHSEFMKYAMNNNAGVFPFVPKGESNLIPARYVISRGSITPLEVSFSTTNDDCINLGFNVAITEERTPTQWMAATLEYANGLLKAGDQLTLVTINHVNKETTGGDVSTGYFPVVTRIVLDPAKDGIGYNSATEWLRSKGLVINEDGEIRLYYSDSQGALHTDAVGAIISRPSVSKTNGAISWLRSNSSMIITNEVQEKFFTQTAYDAAIRTYLPENVNPTSGWYLNDGTLNPENQQTPLAPGVVSYIRNQVVTLRAQEIFGNYALKAVCKNLRKDGMIATPKEPTGDNYAEIQLYALTQNPEQQGSGTVIYKPASLVLVAANEDEMAEINAFLGDMITPDEAIAAMAEEGVTYTKGY